MATNEYTLMVLEGLRKNIKATQEDLIRIKAGLKVLSAHIRKQRKDGVSNPLSRAKRKEYQENIDKWGY